jgi:hypothetical protein
MTGNEDSLLGGEVAILNRKEVINKVCLLNDVSLILPNLHFSFYIDRIRKKKQTINDLLM